MKKTNKFLLGGLGLMGVSVLASSAFVALAYRGDAIKTGPNYSPERHAEMEKAFESNDYQAWKELMNGKGKVMDVINEGNFARFAEMHKLMGEGKTDEANKIRTELGLAAGMGNGMGNKAGQGRRGGNCAFNQSK